MEHWKMKMKRFDKFVLNADNITIIARPDDECCIKIYGAGIENGVEINYGTFERRDKDFSKLSYLISEL